MQEILGRERRRRWSDEEKAQIVAESFRDGVSVVERIRSTGCPATRAFAFAIVRLAQGGEKGDCAER